MDNATKQIRSHLIRLIAKSGGSAAVYHLLSVIRQEGLTDEEIILILEVMPVTEGINYYQELSSLRNTPSADVIYAMIDFLGRSGCKDSLKYLRDIVSSKDGSPSLVSVTLKALGNIGDREDLKTGLDFLQHENPDVVNAAVYLCGKTGDRQTAQLLGRQFSRNCPEGLQLALIEAYASMGETSELIRFLHSGNLSTNVLVNLIMALGKTRSEQVKSSISRFFASSDPVIRLGAIRAMEEFNDFSLIKVIQNSIREFSPIYHQHLLNSAIPVARGNSEKSEELIVKLFSSVLSNSISQLIEEIGNQEFENSLLRILRLGHNERNARDIKEVSTVLKEMSDTSAKPVFQLDLLMNGHEEPVKNGILSIYEKKGLYRKEIIPDDTEVVFCLKIISRANLKKLFPYCIYFLGSDSQIVVREALNVFNRPAAFPPDVLQKILKWLFNRTNSSSVKEAVLNVVSANNLKQMLSFIEESYHDSSAEMKNSILVFLGKMGLNNNMFLLNSLVNLDDQGNVMAFLEALVYMNISDATEKLQIIERAHGHKPQFMSALAKIYLKAGVFAKAEQLLENFLSSAGPSDLVKMLNDLSDVKAPVLISKKITGLLGHQRKDVSQSAFNFLSRNNAGCDFLSEYLKGLIY